MKKNLFVIVVLCLACQEKHIDSFYELYEQARKEDKYLCLNLNFGQDKAITETVYRYSYENKQSEQKYLSPHPKTDIIFSRRDKKFTTFAGTKIGIR